MTRAASGFSRVIARTAVLAAMGLGALRAAAQPPNIVYESEAMRVRLAMPPTLPDEAFEFNEEP